MTLVPWLACWLAFDLAARAAGGRSVLAWGTVVFVPLWFLAVYAGVIAVTPLTARLHAAHRGRVLVALAAGIALAEVLRLDAGVGGPVPGLVGSALVWLLCHQLVFWRTAPWSAAGRRGPRPWRPPGSARWRR